MPERTPLSYTPAMALSYVYRNILVLNPTTKTYRLLPEPSDFSILKVYYAFANSFFLAFEPSKSHHYKVVLFNRELLFSYGDLRFHIFSSESGFWKSNIHAKVQSGFGACCTRTIFLNGGFHWLANNNRHVQFDVDAERLVENRLPPDPHIFERYRSGYFGESNDRLFLIQFCQFGVPGVTMWEMDRDSKSWATKHQINLRPLVLEFPKIASLSRTIRFHYIRFNYSVLFVKSGSN